MTGRDGSAQSGPEGVAAARADPGERRPGLRAVVDREACFGFAFCVGIAPDVFELDAEGISVPRDADIDPARLALAIDSCPRSAIRATSRAADRATAGGPVSEPPG